MRYSTDKEVKPHTHLHLLQQSPKQKTTQASDTAFGVTLSVLALQVLFRDEIPGAFTSVHSFSSEEQRNFSP